VYGSIAISTGFGVLVPQTTLEYIHEFLDPQRKITFRFIDDLNRTPFRFENDRPDRDYFNLGAGIVLVLARGFSPFLNYRALVGYNDQRSHTVTAGLRVEF
jgi:outer membrane autotransporter protein